MGSLSDKIKNLFEEEYLDTMADVQGDVTVIIKEAVKRLKASLFNEAIAREKHISDPSLDRLPLSSINDRIDKIFGDALI